ncbi:hypothetical protein BHYA_0277g00080 [Botrytis hyacinthi]|uniref:Uncharacterized protein n=1 Tax=Botrytis hyacinthi TaxID=278943 RepID=A0A4Z1GA85_9HELO|nr:hypothetical protein BHYA_0277g00080 [Botrytis hyacinthi]
MGHLLRKLFLCPESRFITAYTAIFMFHLAIKPGVTTTMCGLKALEPQAPFTGDDAPRSNLPCSRDGARLERAGMDISAAGTVCRAEEEIWKGLKVAHQVVERK